MIRCLPKEVQGKLRSGVAIPSLQQCVEELILNGLDAGATCVAVRMDMESLKVQVVDNGAGMSAEDMERVGNRYFTSKCSSVEDLDHLRWYGFRGEALASMTSLATLVEISSRSRSSAKTHVKVFKGGRGMDVFEAVTARPSAGTTVVICNFFHSMPVRRLRVDAVLEGERIRHRVEAIALMHPAVSFTLKNDCAEAMLVQLSKAKSVYHRFVQIHTVERAQKLGEIAHARGQFEVTGYICREGHYNGSLQFLYVNGRLLLKTRVHKLLTLLLRRLNISYQKSESPDGHSAIGSPKSKRGQELHGVYLINIKCAHSEYDVCLEPAKTLIEFKDWDGILLCIEEAVKDFLRRENLLVVPSQDDLDCVHPEHCENDNPLNEDDGGKGDRATSTASAHDCSIGMTLASESVHRVHKDVGVSEDTVCQEPSLVECEKNEADFEKMQSEACVRKECRDEPQYDVTQVETASDSDIAEEQEATFGKASSQTPCISGSVRRLEIDTTHSASNLTLQETTIEQIKPDLNSTERHTQAVSNRKISLSDPFVHQSLQTLYQCESNKYAFQQQNPPIKAEEPSRASKGKITLDSGHDRFPLRRCNNSAIVVPAKIPRIEPCQGSSSRQESGSLDKFRRMFGKSHERQIPSPETCLQNSAQMKGLILPTQKSLVRHRDQSDGDVTQTREKESTESAPHTKLKPAAAQNKGKKSLAAKICHLRKHRPSISALSSNIFGTTSQDKIWLGGGNDRSDENGNQSPRDTALNPTPVSGCNTSPRLVEKDEGATSADWLHHYDTSVGKTVYVNRVTGLSKYADPSAEGETRVTCTSDVTNMAVSVVSDTGMEYRCYPFQGDLVLPFLPKSRTERVISSGLDGRVLTDDGDESSNSLTSLYSKWNNPVFVRPPTVGMDVSSRQADGLAVKIHNVLFPYRFSKAMIQSMKVICQVDKKFLACLINTRDAEPAALGEVEESAGNLLVLVDQHAAHERVRLENLVADSYEDDRVASGERRLRSSNILPPLEISATEGELRLLRSCGAHLLNLGLEVKFSQAADPQVLVGKVPLCFMERESNQLKRGRPSVIKPIVEEYLREQIELLQSTGRVRGTLPLTVLKVLASLACHGAIKFNHSLSTEECHSLIASLSSCQLPFQCAHGRPSIIPLVDTLHLDKDQKELQRPNLQKLRRMYRAWQLYGNR